MSKITTTITNANWTAPAGITEVLIMPCDSSGVTAVSPQPITVVPNTTYTITINSSTYVFGNPNTFGSLYTWSGSGYLSIIFVE